MRKRILVDGVSVPIGLSMADSFEVSGVPSSFLDEENLGYFKKSYNSYLKNGTWPFAEIQVLKGYSDSMVLKDCEIALALGIFDGVVSAPRIIRLTKAERKSSLVIGLMLALGIIISVASAVLQTM